MLVAGVDRECTIWEALYGLNLAATPASYDYEPFRVVRDWYQSGAETFSTHFDVVDVNGAVSHSCVMKACVKFTGEPLHQIMRTWVNRRQKVSTLGIGTPRLHGYSGATLIEERIEHNLPEFLRGLRSGWPRESLLFQVGHVAGVLINAGFDPTYLQDWRTRGGDVVLVDFGTDIVGTSSGLHSSVELPPRFITACENSLKVSESDLSVIQSGYIHGFRMATASCLKEK